MRIKNNLNIQARNSWAQYIITSKINLTKDQTIDLNLTELTEFNLKIDKYISKVIVQTAIDNTAQVIGLSALMTTTMPKMEETLKLLKENNLNIPVIVGGAAVDSSFAQSIGAYFGEDAMDTVRIAQQLTNNK